MENQAEKNRARRVSSRRRFLEYITVLGIASIGSFFLNLTIDYFQKKMAGMDTSRVYLVTEVFPRGEVETCGPVLERVNEELIDELTKAINRFQAHHMPKRELEAIVQNTGHLGDEFDAYQIKLRNEAQGLQFIYRYTPVESCPSIGFNEEHFERLYGPVEERARSLFLRITGKDFPSEIPVIGKEGELYNGKGKLTNFDGFFDDGVFFKRSHYARELSTIMHEMGHAINMNPKQAFSKKSSIMSEARAYCFCAAACYYERIDIRNIMLDNFRMARYYAFVHFYNNDDDEYYHAEAMVLADSAIVHFGNPKDAFNYLQVTSYDDIHPEIIERIRRGKEGFDRMQELKNYAEQLCR